MRLREINPLPLLISHLVEIENLEAQRQSLYTVVTELYINALDHGIPGLDSSLKSHPAGLEAYFKARESRLKQLYSGYIVFGLSALQSGTRRAILLRVEDSGDGFDVATRSDMETHDDALNSRALVLVRNLCESLDFEGNGNIAIARFSWETE